MLRGTLRGMKIGGKRVPDKLWMFVSYLLAVLGIVYFLPWLTGSR